MTETQSWPLGAVLGRLVSRQVPRCVLEAWMLPAGFPGKAAQSGESPGLPARSSMLVARTDEYFPPVSQQTPGPP